MSKKKLYLIIGVTAIITIGFFLAAYIISQESVAPKTPGESVFSNFFPFGKNTGNETGGENAGDTGNDETDSFGTGDENGEKSGAISDKTKLPRLRQINKTPTAGMYPFIRSGKTMVQYVERATGNIFETNMEDMRKAKVSNHIIPRVQEVFWGNGGKSLIYRYFNEDDFSIATFVTSAPNTSGVKIETQKSTSTDTVSGSFLEENILHALPSFDSKSLFYLTKTSDFTSRTGYGSVFDFTKNTAKRVFESPFSEWLPVSFDGKTAFIQTKASQNIPGFLYSLNTANGGLQKILGGINGLLALPSPDMQKILYSESTRGGITLRLYDRKNQNTTDIPLSTFPEKCVWTSDSTALYCAVPDYLPATEYPDAWYQGLVAFNDTVWKIDAKTGNRVMVFTQDSSINQTLDMTGLSLSLDGNFLFFINKKDSTLWGYEI